MHDAMNNARANTLDDDMEAWFDRESAHIQAGQQCGLIFSVRAGRKYEVFGDLLRLYARHQYERWPGSHTAGRVMNLIKNISMCFRQATRNALSFGCVTQRDHLLHCTVGLIEAEAVFPFGGDDGFGNVRLGYRPARQEAHLLLKFKALESLQLEVDNKSIANPKIDNLSEDKANQPFIVPSCAMQKLKHYCDGKVMREEHKAIPLLQLLEPTEYTECIRGDRSYVFGVCLYSVE